MGRTSGPATAAGFDRDRARAWLTSPAVLGEDGAVRSWSSREHPGFDYPEAAAIWLGWASWRRRRGEPGPDAATARAVARRLEHALAQGQGLGQQGRMYLFDSCVAIHALARATDAGLTDAVSDETRSGTAAAVERFLDASSPVLPAPDNGSARWSERWGAHQARAAAMLAEAGELLGEAGLQTLADRLGRRAAPPHEGGRRYVHAWLYALEGAMMRGAPDPTLAAQARALAALQREDGGLPVWSDHPGPRRSDSTAQAVRVWSSLDRDAFAAPLRRGLRFLAALQDRDGGLAYEPGSADRTTWATAFADQAAAWAAEGAEPPIAWI